MEIEVIECGGFEFGFIKESFEVQEINAFLCRILDEDHGDSIINGEYFKILDFETIDENSLKILIKDEHKQQYYIYLEGIENVEGDLSKLHIQQFDKKDVNIEMY